MKSNSIVLPFIFFVSAVVLLGALSGAAVAQTGDITLPSEWREKEKVGLGFGLLSGFGFGSQLYLDYNLNREMQLHGAFLSEVQTRKNVFGMTLLETQRSVQLASLRYFPDPEQGWFLGGGGGFARVEQRYALDDNANSSTTFIPVFFDGGWQGWDGYYFTVNLFLGFGIELSSTDNTNNITHSSNRNISKQDFEDSKSFSIITIGFGWYL